METGAQSSIIGLLIIGAMLVIVAGFVAWFIWKLLEQKRRERAATQTFEREFELQFIRPNAGIVRNPQKPETQAQPDAPVPEQGLYPSREPDAESAPLAASQAEKPPAPAPSAASPSDQLIARLKEAGLFESNEGAYLPLDPSGSCILLHLKRRKTALIIPRFESEHFLSQAIKRFDYVFLILGSQEILVLNKYSDFIAGHYQMK